MSLEKFLSLTKEEEIIAYAKKHTLDGKFWKKRFEIDSLFPVNESDDSPDWIKNYKKSLWAKYRAKEELKKLEEIGYYLTIAFGPMTIFPIFDFPIEVVMEAVKIFEKNKGPYYFEIRKFTKYFIDIFPGSNPLMSTDSEKFIYKIIYVAVYFGIKVSGKSVL